MSIEVWVIGSEDGETIEGTEHVASTPAEAISIAESYRTRFEGLGIVRLVAEAMTSDDDLASLTEMARLHGFRLERTLP